jgi:hydrogenase nickel incorporation protein HypA/HybF
MHELAISESITELVVDCAQRGHIARVARVVVEIGAAAGVDPDALMFCFPVTTVETAAAGAELVINRVELQMRCEDCGEVYSPKTQVSSCPICGSFASQLLAGREMRVVSIEGE